MSRDFRGIGMAMSPAFVQSLGFPSQSFFGKYFKRATGFYPSAYRDL